MDAVISYKNNTYIVTLTMDMDAFEYVTYFKEAVKTEKEVELILKNATINNEVDIHKFTHAFKFEEGKWYFYDYTFEYWDCIDDYITRSRRNELPKGMWTATPSRKYNFEV